MTAKKAPVGAPPSGAPDCTPNRPRANPESGTKPKPNPQPASDPERTPAARGGQQERPEEAHPHAEKEIRIRTSGQPSAKAPKTKPGEEAETKPGGPT